MSSTVRAIVKPELLVWARTSAGFSIAGAAAKVPVKAESLEAWEEGRSSPTIRQLRKLGEIYKRPLAVFYLPEPPRDFDAMHDFRRLPGQAVLPESPGLRLQIRKAGQRRQLALDLYQMIGEDIPTPGLDLALTDDPERAGQQLRELLHVSTSDQFGWRGHYEALNVWRSRLESSGILVFHARDVELTEVRGISISDTPLPAVVLNIKDAPAGRIFTALHETAHVLLRQGGLCDLSERQGVSSEEQRVEVFCNHVAGATLIPLPDVLAEGIVSSHRGTIWADEGLERLARKYKTSREVVFRRLLMAGRTSEAFYRERRAAWAGQVEDSGRTHEGFAPPWVLAVSSCGPHFARLVLRAYYQEKITTRDVADFLDVRLKHLPRIEREIMGREIVFEGAK